MEDGANEERLGRKARHFPFEIILWSKKENFIVPQENLQKLLVIILYSSECVHALCNNRGSSKLTTKTLGLCNCKLYPHHIVFVLCITEKVDKRMFFVKCNIEREIEKRAFSSPTHILTINRHRKTSSFRWKHKLYFLYLWLEVSPNFTINATSKLSYKLFKAKTTRFGLMNGFLQFL